MKSDLRVLGEFELPPEEIEESAKIVRNSEAATSPESPIKLTRIGSLTLNQQTFTLGKHANKTYLTLSTPDAFGDPRAEIIDLKAWLLSDGVDESINKAQLLLNELGQYMQSVVSSRSLKGGS